MIVIYNCRMNVQLSFDVSDCPSIMVEEQCKKVVIGHCLNLAMYKQIGLLYFITLSVETVE
jgi:hypothetical protein